jgi:hypothetical protein
LQKKQRTDRVKSKGAARNKKKFLLENNEWGGFLLLAALSLLLFLPVFLNPYLNGDDAAQHYWWSKEFIHELSKGTLYPRWLSGAYEGRGSPTLFYYPPVPFYITSFFYVFIRDPLLSLYWSCCLGLLVSGITLYFYSKTFLSQRASFLAAAFYMTVHYHLFDFYQRLAQHEFWAFAWVPLLLYGINRLNVENHWRAGLYVASGYALLLMTHLPTALMITFLLPIYLLILTRNVRKLTYVVAGLILGAGLSAIFLFSFLFGRDYLKPLGARAANQSYRAGFLFENLSEAFKQVPLPSNSNFDLFLLAGDWMAVGFLVLLVVCTLSLWKSEFRQNNTIRGLWIITIFSLLMGTRLTTPVWRFVPQIRNIQFPIRWFTIVSLGASLLIALAVSLAIRNLRSPYLQASALAIVILLNVSISWLIISRAPLQREIFQRRISSYTDVREYHPLWWDQQRHSELDAAPAVVVNGKASVIPVDAEGISQSYTINAEEDSLLKFRTLYFPGWQAQIDGQAVTVSPNEEGHMQVAVAQGEHLLTLRLKDTRVQTVGRIISGVSLLVFLAIFFAARRKSTEPQNIENSQNEIEAVAATRGKRKQAEK